VLPRERRCTCSRGDTRRLVSNAWSYESLSVFGVDGLAGNAERLTDLLPRPPLLAGGRDVVCLDPFREPMQS
jgi:hypothetical protein